jgi:hypothetical protein
MIERIAFSKNYLLYASQISVRVVILKGDHDGIQTAHFFRPAG